MTLLNMWSYMPSINRLKLYLSLSWVAKPLIHAHVWEDIAMDFMIGYDSKLVARVFIKNTIKLHDMLKSVVLDKDKVFTSKLW